MLHLIIAAHLEITPQTLSNPPLVSPDTHQQLDRFLQKQQIQQLEGKLNGTQKHYEQEQHELQTLPSSRLECFHRFPPVAGSDPISCSRP
ncbi:MAG: hypothetical protein PUP93_24490 [Rhizonema sp. NSF051]|nr:hypothetical protein [Rhizonema sp. NSF051]